MASQVVLIHAAMSSIATAAFGKKHDGKKAAAEFQQLIEELTDGE